MEKQMKDFMHGLADLMEQHGVEIEPNECWSGGADGMVFTMSSKWSEEDQTIIGTDDVATVPFNIFVTPEDIRQLC